MFFFGQFTFAHVVERRRVDQILGVFSAQHLKEVKAGFALACGEISKLIIADDAAVAVAVLMAGTGVINMQPLGAGVGGGEHLLGFID